MFLLSYTVYKTGTLDEKGVKAVARVMEKNPGRMDLWMNPRPGRKAAFMVKKIHAEKIARQLKEKDCPKSFQLNIHTRK